MSSRADFVDVLLSIPCAYCDELPGVVEGCPDCADLQEAALPRAMHTPAWAGSCDDPSDLPPPATLPAGPGARQAVRS